MTWLWSAAILVNALLLFWLEPMAAKMLLPFLGGTAAVWNTCLMFFQVTLVAGYAYAHLLNLRLGVKAAAAVHITLLIGATATLPVVLNAQPPAGSPTTWLIGRLAVMIGLPFFALSTHGPLLQAWFARAGHAGSANPYVLFAASNVGSLAALLGFPLLIEPTLDLATQSSVWSGAFTALACCICVYLAATVLRQRASLRPEAPAADAWSLRWKDRLAWTVLAAVPSSLLLGVTSYVASNIASLPFLWVLPLSLYLLTFVVVFSPSQRIRALPDALTRMPLFARSMASWVLPVAVTAALVGVTIAATSSVVWLGLLHLMIFFVLALHLHRQLADRRPPPRRLGEYYVWMGIGGALGGVLNAVVAPLVFTRVHEYPFILAVALMLRPALFKERVRALDLLLPLALGVAALAVPWGARATGYLAPGFDLRYLLALPAAIAFAFYARPLRFGLAVLALLWASSFYPGSAGWPSYVARSFYNVHRVLDDHANGIRWLENGNTLHGAQSPRDPDAPLGYYHRTGPLGDIFKEPRAPARTAVVGLGAGAMLAYARADEPWTVYEIDPTVVEIARDSGYFSYLERSRATPKVILGDGRLGLAAALPGAFDLIVVDAFGSDAVPVHLLTEEALDLYWSRLGSSPRLLFHVSNRYLNLAPLIGGWALARGLSAWEKIDLVEEEDERRLGKMSSHWILVSRAAPPEGWAMVPARAEGGLRWTDGHSSLLYLLGVARQ